MKKIIVWASVLALSLGAVNFASADHHGETMHSDSHEMMEMGGEYGMFTDMVRDDLTETEKTELKELVEQQKAWTEMIKMTVWKVKSWELNNFEEFAKIAPKRKAMIDKLKVFMKDAEAFEYMCMNHWDELISKLFADDVTVNKYKKAFEEKHSNQINELYSKKWKALEKLIHKAYHKNIDSKNLQTISVLRALELIVEDIKNPKMSWEMMKEEFGGFTKFAKKDLTKMQKDALLELLEERKVAQAKFKKMLSEAKENWNFDEVFEIVQNKRAGCQSRFSLYLDETKKEEFNSHCKIMWENLKAMYK